MANRQVDGKAKAEVDATRNQVGLANHELVLGVAQQTVIANKAGFFAILQRNKQAIQRYAISPANSSIQLAIGQVWHCWP